MDRSFDFTTYVYVPSSYRPSRVVLSLFDYLTMCVHYAVFLAQDLGSHLANPQLGSDRSSMHSGGRRKERTKPKMEFSFFK